MAALRVASWNVQLGLRLADVLQGVGRLGHPALLALQEVSEHDGRPDADRFACRLGGDYQAYQATAQHVRGKPQANALVWDTRRFEAVSSEVVDLPMPAGRMLRRLPESRRNALLIEGRFEGRTLRVYTVHLDVLGIVHKHVQLLAVLEDADRRHPVDVTLIAGDLNTYGLRGRPRWAGLRMLVEGHGFEDVTVDVGWTHRARGGIRQKLDALLVRPPGLDWRARAEPLDGSDHIPIVAEAVL
jgi:endonuclease/exonuclease/phosphatase family metal-dependent hydrolase